MTVESALERRQTSGTAGESRETESRRGSSRLGRSLRVLGAGVRVAEANVRRLDAPLKLTMALTYWCQYKCEMCNIWQKRPKDELTTDEILEFIRRNRSFRWVDLTGGEIFLRRDLPEIFDEIARSWNQLAVLHFATNGYKTKQIVSTVEEMASRLRSMLVITVSLDGYEELNDRIRGIAGGYRKQVDTFNGLRRIPGVKVVFGMTLSQSNAHAVDETIRACLRDCPGMTEADFHLNVMQVSDHYYSNSEMENLSPPRDVALEALEKHQSRQSSGSLLAPSAWLQKRYLRGMKRFLEDDATPMRCHSLRSTCFVDPWGKVFPCITYDRPVGSLRDHGMMLEPIWNGDEAKALQQEIWNDDCPQCWTACEAFPSIMGNALAPWRWRQKQTQGA